MRYVVPPVATVFPPSDVSPAMDVTLCTWCSPTLARELAATVTSVSHACGP